MCAIFVQQRLIPNRVQVDFPLRPGSHLELRNPHLEVLNQVRPISTRTPSSVDTIPLLVPNPCSLIPEP